MTGTFDFRKMFTLATLFAASLHANSIIDLSTYTDAWFANLAADEGGTVSAPAVHNNPGNPGVTLSFATNVGMVSGGGVPGTGTPTGTYLQGSSPQSFNGIWYLDAPFDLPSGAYNVKLTLSFLNSDDRAQVFLNQMPNPAIADAASDPAVPLVTQYRYSTYSGTGLFGHEIVLPNCSSHQPGCVNDQSNVQYNPLLDGLMTITSGFHIGGRNHLTIFINNVSCGLDDQSCANAGSIQMYPNSADGSWVQMLAVVSFDVAVPEPGTYLAMGSGLLALIGWRRTRR